MVGLWQQAGIMKQSVLMPGFYFYLGNKQLFLTPLAFNPWTVAYAYTVACLLFSPKTHFRMWGKAKLPNDNTQRRPWKLSCQEATLSTTAPPMPHSVLFYHQAFLRILCLFKNCKQI